MTTTYLILAAVAYMAVIVGYVVVGFRVLRSVVQDYGEPPSWAMADCYAAVVLLWPCVMTTWLAHWLASKLRKENHDA